MNTQFVIAQGSFEDVRYFTKTCRWAKPTHPNVRYFPSVEDARMSGECMPLIPAGGWRVLEVQASEPGKAKP